DNGIIIPPKLATIQVAVVPIARKPEERERVMQAVNAFTAGFKRGGIGFKVDDREQYSPGWKYNEWEKRGIPLRIEVGPRDLDKNQVMLVRRDNGQKTPASQDGLTESVRSMLDAIQSGLFEKAKAFREANTRNVD